LSCTWPPVSTINLPKTSNKKQSIASSIYGMKAGKEVSQQKITAFKRLRVSLESKVGCLYFFEKRSLTIDLLPTKVDSKTLWKECKISTKIINCKGESSLLVADAKLKNQAS
jgi:hypothetical protein